MMRPLKVIIDEVSGIPDPEGVDPIVIVQFGDKEGRTPVGRREGFDRFMFESSTSFHYEGLGSEEIRFELVNVLKPELCMAEGEMRQLNKRINEVDRFWRGRIALRPFGEIAVSLQLEEFQNEQDAPDRCDILVHSVTGLTNFGGMEGVSIRAAIDQKAQLANPANLDRTGCGEFNQKLRFQYNNERICNLEYILGGKPIGQSSVDIWELRSQWKPPSVLTKGPTEIIGERDYVIGSVKVTLELWNAAFWLRRLTEGLGPLQEAKLRAEEVEKLLALCEATAPGDEPVMQHVGASRRSLEEARLNVEAANLAGQGGPELTRSAIREQEKGVKKNVQQARGNVERAEQDANAAAILAIKREWTTGKSAKFAIDKEDANCGRLRLSLGAGVVCPELEKLLLDMQQIMAEANKEDAALEASVAGSKVAKTPAEEICRLQEATTAKDILIALAERAAKLNLDAQAVLKAFRLQQRKSNYVALMSHEGDELLDRPPANCCWYCCCC